MPNYNISDINFNLGCGKCSNLKFDFKNKNNDLICLEKEQIITTLSKTIDYYKGVIPIPAWCPKYSAKDLMTKELVCDREKGCGSCSFIKIKNGKIRCNKDNIKDITTVDKVWRKDTQIIKTPIWCPKERKLSELEIKINANKGCGACSKPVLYKGDFKCSLNNCIINNFNSFQTQNNNILKTPDWCPKNVRED